jgi:hypothetical protein
MAANDGEHPVTSLFGSDLPAGTGAMGTPTVPASVSAGPSLGTVTVTPNFGSSQVQQPTVVVTTGDTCAMSSEAPVPAGGDPLTGLTLGQVADTGAGHGSARDLSPNAMGVPPMGAQLAQARRPS